MTRPSLTNLRPRERLLASGCALVVLVVLLDHVVLRPWMAHMATVRAEIAQMEVDLKTREQLLLRRYEVLDELSRYQRYVSKPALDEELHTAELVTEVQDLAAKSHVTLKVKPLPAEDHGSGRRFTLELSFACTVEEWLDFLYQLDTSPSLFETLRGALAIEPDHHEQLIGSLRIASTLPMPVEPSTATMKEDRANARTPSAP